MCDPAGGGATTLYEALDLTPTYGQNSRNHQLFGVTGGWYFSALAGLGRAPGSRSWTRLAIAPPDGAVLANLTWAAASIDTPMGLASSSWVGPADDIFYVASCTVPVGAVADVRVPTVMFAVNATIVEGAANSTVWTRAAFVPGTPGVTAGVASPDTVSVHFTVGSGSYVFTVLPPA